ncbi:hypothetical protein [Methylomonas sp. AM2-LC]|uniref:hypothetical protein n=1 Tax=Methylomonas sp. AM2-LC TaxID=3153301 RepID=UPI003266E628
MHDLETLNETKSKPSVSLDSWDSIRACAISQLDLDETYELFLGSSEVDYLDDAFDSARELLGDDYLSINELISITEDKVARVKLPKGFLLVGLNSKNDKSIQKFGVIKFSPSIDKLPSSSNEYPTLKDYNETIDALLLAKTQLSPNGNNCVLCGDSDHQAFECGHNPLLHSRLWSKAESVWRCWHCGYTAITADEAVAHFGVNESEDAACLRNKSKPKKLFLIKQSASVNYDEYSGAVVVAYSEKDAMQIHPDGSGVIQDWSDAAISWVSNPCHIDITYLGIAEDGLECGVVLAAFKGE